MNILIRADSSSTIGIGHVMRDLVLAEQYPNDRIIFATQDLLGNINDRIIKTGYPLEILNSNDKDELVKTIIEFRIDLIIIDHYGIDYDYETYIKQKTNCKILCLDDTYEKHNCDTLMNHNISADISKYIGLVPDDCDLRCGSEFTLIRKEFIEERKKNKIIKKNSELITVFIAMGGADHSNINIKVLDVLSELPSIKAIVVTTGANNNLTELQDYCLESNWIDLHVNSDKVAYLMRISDFAIVTPSVVLNEVMFMGLPFIAIQTANNQTDICNYLVNKKYSVLREFSRGKLTILVRSKILDLASLSLKSFAVINKAEKELILSWRNNFSIRKWMYNSEIITVEEHNNFIDHLPSYRDRLYFLVLKGTIPIGVINLTKINKTDKSADIGVYAKPNQKGVGKLLMNEICNLGFHKMNLDKLHAEVFCGNDKAISLYEFFDFKEYGRKIVNNRNVLCLELNRENW